MAAVLAHTDQVIFLEEGDVVDVRPTRVTVTGVERRELLGDCFGVGPDGADVSTQQYFIYIASREGNCNFKAVNINPATRDDSHCTFQINALSGTFEPNGQLGRRGWTKDNIKASMQNCADAASDLWVFCARGPWTPPTYTCSPPWAGDLGPNGDV